MSASDTDPVRCSRCRAELVTGTVSGLCPVCLLDNSLGDAEENTRASFRYDLVEEIAHGGMGIVYRAIQHGSEREVAVKMILTDHVDAADLLG